jgi:Ser/Thr protein kinase RdoA (MazF antagonist)
VIDEDRLSNALAAHWGLVGAQVKPHHGGMNSGTWFVAEGDRRWVAKAVAPNSGRAFAAGLSVAARLEQQGIRAGAPQPCHDGRAVVSVDGVPLALLTWVPGEPLPDAGPDSQQVLGTTLGQVHAALADVEVAGTEAFHWVDPDAEHLGVQPWIRGEVAAAVTALDRLGPESLRSGLLHADPAPEAFRLDAATGECGLIDWAGALRGPLLYDLASAVMYVGGPERAGRLIAAYLGQGAMSVSEVERGLTVMLRFRWAVQADYFARRTVTGDLTGIADASGNEQGLDHARHWLARVGGR